MLSLPYNYDILSLGILTPQVRGMDAELVDQSEGWKIEGHKKILQRSLN